VNPAAIQGFPANFLIGSVDQRTLLKNYDTGSDRIDVIVVGGLTSTDLGEAMMHGVSINANSARHAIDSIRFSLVIVQAAMNAGDLNYDVFPHEMGHVLMDLIHAIGPRGAEQLICISVYDRLSEVAMARIKPLSIYTPRSGVPSYGCECRSRTRRDCTKNHSVFDRLKKMS